MRTSLATRGTVGPVSDDDDDYGVDVIELGRGPDVAGRRRQTRMILIFAERQCNDDRITRSSAHLIFPSGATSVVRSVYFVNDMHAPRR